MARRKILSDADVLSAARRLCCEGGEKALTFGTLARATGLAASTLAQRFTTVTELQARAARDGWQQMLQALDAAESASSGKGPQGLLKALEPEANGGMLLLSLGRRDAEALDLATEWRGRVETALSLRIGQGDKARDTARMLFAAWQGRLMWDSESFRLKDLVKRLN